MPVGLGGIHGRIADTLNEIVELNQGMAEEFERISPAVGREGRTRERASLPNATKGWAACIEFNIRHLFGAGVHRRTERAPQGRGARGPKVLPRRG